MKKRLLIMALSLAIMNVASSNTCTALADMDSNSSTITYVTESNNENVSISEYMKNVYTVTQCPELDETVYNIFKTYENNKNSSSPVYVYSGTYENCVKLMNYFNINYGYTYDIHLTLIKQSNSYGLCFENTLNADVNINNYLNEVNKAQAIATSLKGTSQDETIANIINWVKVNAKYFYTDYNVDEQTGVSHYYGIYSGNEVLCKGYAMAVYQLCAMNGIKASVIDIVSNKGLNHTANTVVYSDKERFVDTMRKDSVSDTLWEGFRYFN